MLPSLFACYIVDIVIDYSWMYASKTISFHRGASTTSNTLPRVLLLLGCPGSGKGTQSEKLLQYYNCHHISAGECLRKEIEIPHSPHKALITSTMLQGKVVPSAITVALIEKEILEAHQKNEERFIVLDGFPRNEENMKAWIANAEKKVKTLGCINLHCDPEVSFMRLVSRGRSSGRIDDNEETIRQRIRNHVDDSLPILERYKQCALLHEVDSNGNAEEVWAQIREIVEKLVRP